MVLLVRNPILIKYRKSGKTDEAKVKNQIRKEEDEQQYQNADDKLIAESEHDNANLCFQKDRNTKNFYRKKGPSRRMHEDDSNHVIALKKKIPRNKNKDKNKKKKNSKKNKKKGKLEKVKIDKNGESKEKNKKKTKPKSKTKEGKKPRGKDNYKCLQKGSNIIKHNR